MNPIDRFKNLFDSEWSVIPFEDDRGNLWFVVDDIATCWFTCESDISEEDLNKFDADRASEDDETRTNAYSILCQSIDAYHDDEVPTEVLRAAQEYLGTDSISHGW